MIPLPPRVLQSVLPAEGVKNGSQAGRHHHRHPPDVTVRAGRETFEPDQIHANKHGHLVAAKELGIVDPRDFGMGPLHRVEHILFRQCLNVMRRELDSGKDGNVINHDGQVDGLANFAKVIEDIVLGRAQ